MSTTSLPTNMRAVLHDQATHKLSIGTVPLPTPTGSQYLIASSAAAFTVGELDWPRPPELTVSTPGVEFTGRVVSLPSAVSSPKFKIGDAVYARVPYPQAGGAREYTVASEDELARKPTSLSSVETAAVPVSALTAWQWLFEQGGLTPPGDDGKPTLSRDFRVLVTGAAGNVGMWAVQIASLAGATVVGTANGPTIDQVKGFGAHEVIDYTKTDVKTWAQEDPSRKVDLVLEVVGGAMATSAWHAIKEGGKFRSIVPPADMQWKFDLEAPEGVKGVEGKFFIMHPDGEQLGKISQLIKQGNLKTAVDSTWEFDEAEKAIERFTSRKARGKVVLKVGQQWV